MGKLIIIEGGDGSGKATQTRLLLKRLQQEGYPVQSVSFPDYESPSSALVRMYLGGEFGTKANDVNPFVASTFYAADRFASYRTKWQKFFVDGGIIVADRYTTSNMVHQMVKISDPIKRKEFLTWLDDLEFVKFGLPRPDLVCLLDVPRKLTEKLMSEREHKTGGMTGDIHEKDSLYLDACHNAYDELVQAYHWCRISCGNEMKMRDALEIHEDLYEKVKLLLSKNNIE